MVERRTWVEHGRTKKKDGTAEHGKHYTPAAGTRARATWAAGSAARVAMRDAVRATVAERRTPEIMMMGCLCNRGGWFRKWLGRVKVVVVVWLLRDEET